MKTASSKTGSLEGKIFTTLSVFSVVVILVFALAVSGIYFVSFESNAEELLSDTTLETAAVLDALPEQQQISILQEQVSGQLRYTLIAPDGTVVYDSYQEATELENHADRPEIAGARETGYANSARYSATLQTDTLYSAARLSDGSTVRLAETRNSLFSFQAGMLLPLTVSLVLTVVAVFVLSRVLTRRIMRPLGSLNFKEPLKNNVYREMSPFLERINEQQALLKQQNEELLTAENMRREFSANVSHEMKTPLQVISGYAELLKNGMVASEDKEKFASLIYDEAQAMRLIINDVLTLSRLDEPAPREIGERINLYTMARKVVERLSSFALSYGVSVRVEGQEAYLVGNEMLAEEMLYNLIENGIRYNREHGEVVMTVRLESKGPVITVRDTGTGIPADQTDKIFERFFRIEKSRSKETGGTGLGLAIVKHAVLYHGGTIEVESELGIGTLFTLKFFS